MDSSLLVHDIREKKLELARLDPRRGMPVLPPIGATSRALASLSRRVALPPSYLAFLASHDGWPQFFQGASLLGAQQLVRGTYVDLARLMTESADVLPFGIDTKAETIFAFEGGADSDGERGVLLFVNEICERFDGFPSFLEFVRDVIVSEVDERRRAARGFDRFGRPLLAGVRAA